MKPHINRIIHFKGTMYRDDEKFDENIIEFMEEEEQNDWQDSNCNRHPTMDDEIDDTIKDDNDDQEHESRHEYDEANCFDDPVFDNFDEVFQTAADY